MRLSLNKLRYYFVLSLLGLLNTHLTAQEEFLSLDSIVILHGNMNAYGQNGYIYGRDTIVKPLGINQTVKIRNVQVTVERSGSQTPPPGGNQFTTSNYQYLFDVFVKINDDLVYDINSYRNGLNNGYWGGGAESFTRISSKYDSNMFFDSDLNIVAGIYGYQYSRSLNQVITYRIELIYYSYE